MKKEFKAVVVGAAVAVVTACANTGFDRLWPKALEERSHNVMADQPPDDHREKEINSRTNSPDFVVGQSGRGRWVLDHETNSWVWVPFLDLIVKGN